MPGNVLLPSQNIATEAPSSHQNLVNRSGEHDSLTVPSHPLRIKPAGNVYTATENIKLAAGSIAALPDQLLVQVLESLDATSLRRLGCTCKALYAFSRLEELWKTSCIEYELLLSDTVLWTSCCHHLILQSELGDLIVFAVVWPSFVLVQKADLFLVWIICPQKCTYHIISVPFSNICYGLVILHEKLPMCCESSFSKDKRMLKDHLLGLPLPFLRGAEHGALPT